MILLSEGLSALCRVLAGVTLATGALPGARSLPWAALAGVGTALAMRFAPSPLFAAAACGAAGLMLCLHTAGHGDRRRNLFFCLMLQIGLCVWDFIAGAALSRLTGVAALAQRAAAMGQAPLWAVTAALALAALLLLRNADKAPRAASLAAVGAVLGVSLLAEAAPADTSFTYLILAVVLLSGVMVDRLSRQVETEKELADLRARQAELVERDYRALNRAYADNAKTFHDMHNHLGALRSLLAAGKADKAMAYLDELQGPVAEVAATVWTGDDAVDYLINVRIAQAQREGIRFDAQVEFPPNTNVGGADLCAVLGNLVDNAFDAVRRMESGEKWIRLTVRRINRMLVIKVVNPFSGQVRREGDRLLSGKGGSLHGWGVESARTAAEKYDGAITITAEEGVFTAVATLCF